jgi:hypothetical protein
MESTYIGKVEDGAMVEAPVYESHARGKNWMATIEADPAAPGGLAREFIRNGRGRYLYIVGPEVVGKAVEIAADYTSSGGKRHPKRWYGVVRNMTDREIVIDRHETPEQAIRAARSRAAFDAQIRDHFEHIKPDTGDVSDYFVHDTVAPDRVALEGERARLLARVAEIDAVLGGGE